VHDSLSWFSLSFSRKKKTKKQKITVRSFVSPLSWFELIADLILLSSGMEKLRLQKEGEARLKLIIHAEIDPRSQHRTLSLLPN